MALFCHHVTHSQPMQLTIDQIASNDADSRGNTRDHLRFHHNPEKWLHNK